MSTNDNKKYYWLKLQDDFFKRHDIRIVENMPNGKDYIIFYLKLLCESTSHEGRLRFSQEIPYNDEMLSTITNTNIDIVRSAIKVLSQLKMMEILDDGTLYMHQLSKMIGSEMGSAKRKREYRNKQKLLIGTNEGQCPQDIEIDIDKEKDIDKCNSTKSKAFVPPTLEEVITYCKERNNEVDAERFIDFYSSKGWYVGKNKMKDWKASVRTWEKDIKANQKQEIKPVYDTSNNPEFDEEFYKEILISMGRGDEL